MMDDAFILELQREASELAPIADQQLHEAGVTIETLALGRVDGARIDEDVDSDAEVLVEVVNELETHGSP